MFPAITQVVVGMVATVADPKTIIITAQNARYTAYQVLACSVSSLTFSQFRC